MRIARVGGVSIIIFEVHGAREILECHECPNQRNEILRVGYLGLLFGITERSARAILDEI